MPITSVIYYILLNKHDPLTQLGKMNSLLLAINAHTKAHKTYKHGGEKLKILFTQIVLSAFKPNLDK